MKRLFLVLGFALLCACASAQTVSNNIRSLLSSEGRVVYGSEPNSIVVIDYPENVDRVEEYLNTIDVAPQQVLIEARIIEVKLQGEHSLGVNWQLFADKGYLPLGRFKLGGAETFGTIYPGPVTQSISYKNTYSPPNQVLTGSENPFTFGIFDDNINIVVRTLANSLDTNILSAPQITTVNNRPAEIRMIQNYPWAEPQATTSDSGAVTVTWTIHYESIGITLQVTPTISEDDNIIMELAPQVSEKSGEIELETSGITYTVPIIDSRNASTKVVVGNGQTLIIGGLIKDKLIKNETKVPFMADLPLLGALFKSKKDIKDKTELIFFVSPTIITSEEFTRMAKMERYGIGRDYMKERQDKERIRAVREKSANEKKEKQGKRVSCLEEKHQKLVQERQKLEADIQEEEARLSELENTD